MKEQRVHTVSIDPDGVRVQYEMTTQPAEWLFIPQNIKVTLPDGKTVDLSDLLEVWQTWGSP